MASVSPLATFYYQTLGLQRNINQNQNLLDRTIERLNTGLRVNRAADDPFGITQAKRVQTQQISNRQASSNTAQAINLFATAETGAKGIQNNLNRMRELILQSLNDTATDSDRTQIQKEIDKLVQDTDQIARSTLFNTRQLLDGSLGNFRLTQNANSVLSQNKTLTDSAGNSLSFLTGNPTVSNQIENYDLVQFQLFDNGSGGYGLNVSTASGGVVLSYNDVLNAPTSLNVPVGGSTVNFDRAAYVNTPIYSREALTNTELNDTLDNLVSAGRLSPVSFGSLDLNVGSQSFGSFYNVTGTSSIQSLLDSVNSLSPGLSASYNTSTGLISVNYSEQVTETTSLTTPFISAGTTTGVGGPYNSFALLPSAPQGPAYRDPSAFLPATGFNLNSPPSGFPSLPGSLNTALSFTGSDSSFLNVFGLSDSSNNGLVTGYTPLFYGEALATGNPGEYVNRTLVSIQNVSASQDLGGSNTVLTAGDLNSTFEVLNTAIVSSSTFAAGNFTIDFGSNGIFDYQSATGSVYNPNTNSIQDILTAINNFKPGSVSATFNAAAGELTLSNTPDPAVVNAKVTDPGLSSGLFSIDFGSNGTFNHTLTLGSSTIPDLLTALNSFNPNVSASFDANSDTLSLSNTVSPAYNTQITNPGLSVGGSLNVDYGSNGSRSIVLSNTTTIQDVVSALSATGVTVSYDENADTLNFTNTANGPTSTTDTKVTNPPLQAGTFQIDFGNGRVYSYAFDPSSTTIQSFQNNLNAWGASNGVTAGYDSNTDQFTISNAAPGVVTSVSQFSDTQGIQLRISGDIEGVAALVGSMTSTSFVIDLGLVKNQSIDQIVATINALTDVPLGNMFGSSAIDLEADFSGDKLSIRGRFGGGNIYTDAYISVEDYGTVGTSFGSLFNLSGNAIIPGSPRMPFDTMYQVESTANVGIGSDTNIALGDIFATTTTTTGSNQISITDGGTGLAAFFKLSGRRRYGLRACSISGQCRRYRQRPIQRSCAGYRRHRFWQHLFAQSGHPGDYHRLHPRRRQPNNLYR
jgi:flagellin-like hook-associated protein FlgL